MVFDPAPYHADVALGPQAEAYWVTSDDGLKLRVGVWGRDNQAGTVLLFTGRTEYLEKYGDTAGAFDKAGLATLSIDWRGQGLAQRLLDNPAVGHIGIFSDYQRDVAAMLDAARALSLPEPYYLLGHSMGGCIGLRALHDGLPVAAAAFTAPMWGIVMSPALRPAAWTLSTISKTLGFGHLLSPGTKMETYVLSDPFEDNMLTRDRAMFEQLQQQVSQHPELALGGPSLAWLNEALRETRRLAALPAPDVPCLTFLGSDERIVEPQRIHQIMGKWPKGTLRIVPDGEHEVLMEAPEVRQGILAEIAAFFTAQQTEAPQIRSA